MDASRHRIPMKPRQVCLECISPSSVLDEDFFYLFGKYCLFGIIRKFFLNLREMANFLMDAG